MTCELNEDHDEYCSECSTCHTCVEEIIEDLKAQLAHMTANHRSLVTANALLRQRPDLPVDRIPAIRRLEELEAENKKLREFNPEEPNEYPCPGCGAGDNNHHSYTCTVGLHWEKKIHANDNERTEDVS